VADAQVETRIVACLADAKRAAAKHAQTLGYACHVHAEFLADDASHTGHALARSLLAATPGVHIWGGETTVVLPACPGRGGRNQTLALAAALALQDHDDCVLLALASDGSDGPGEDAGALIDRGSVARGVQAGCDAQQCLTNADAGTFLEASGDLVHTGPTGTNVMDILIGIKTA
jgi:hydroxypyruvate reductase